MKNFLLLALSIGTFFGVPQTVAPPAGIANAPQRIAVDSRDNVFVTLKYGMLKIAPDGSVTDLSNVGPPRGRMDRSWSNLVIDSKDNLYVTELVANACGAWHRTRRKGRRTPASRIRSRSDDTVNLRPSIIE
jgi:hypothetical protein